MFQSSEDHLKKEKNISREREKDRKARDNKDKEGSVVQIPLMAGSPGQRAGKRKERNDDISDKLDWLVEEIMEIKRTIGKKKEEDTRKRMPPPKGKKDNKTERKRVEGTASLFTERRTVAKKDSGVTWS